MNNAQEEIILWSACLQLTLHQNTGIVCGLVHYNLLIKLEINPLANTKQAKKRARQAEKHRRHNASMRSLFRNSVKKVITAIASKNQDAAFAALAAATPIIDRMVGKGIVHKNKAARHKSRLVAHIRKLSGDSIAA